MIVKISDIKIGQRVRDEYGDMESLANSIKEHGLLHPIVVDSDYNLIAGCRRLLACERIGFDEIEAKVLEDISQKELRILELEENIRRKDLTEIEKSKNLVELAQIKEQELIKQTEKEIIADSVKADTYANCAESAHLNNAKVNWTESVHLNDPNRIGVRIIAKEIGVPSKTLHDAKQHVKAVEEFPPLENLPKYKAIETAKELRASSSEEQEKILDFVSKKSQLPSIQKEEDFYSYMDDCAKVAKKYHKALYAFLDINADERDFKMLSEVVTPQTVETYLYEAEDAMSKISKVRNFMKGVLENEKNKNVRI